MYINLFNSIYLRPTGQGFYNQWTSTTKDFSLIDDPVYFPHDEPPTPTETNYNLEFVGGRDNIYAAPDVSDKDKIQSWKFEQPSFEGSVDYINLWTLSNYHINIGSYFQINFATCTPRIYTSGSWRTLPAFQPTVLFDSATIPQNTGVFRWYKQRVNGPFTSGDFANFEVGLSHGFLSTYGQSRHEAVYVEIPFKSHTPLYISGGIASQFGSIPLYVQSNDNSIDVPLYVHGRGIIHTGSLDLYTDSVYKYNWAIPLVIEGVPNQFASPIPLYTCGPLPSEGSLDLLLFNANPQTGIMPFYTYGFDYGSGDLGLYTFGVYLSNTGLPLSIKGPSGISMDFPLYTAGYAAEPYSSGLNLYIQQSSIFLNNGWYSYNKLYDNFDAYIEVSKNRVKYGTPPFTNPLPYSGIYDFFRPYESGLTLPTYDPGRFITDADGNWLEGVFVSGVAFIPPDTPGFGFLMPYAPFESQPHRIYFAPYIPQISYGGTKLFNTFESYLNEYLDPYGIIHFGDFLENYFRSNHSGYYSVINSWSNGAFYNLDSNQLYLLSVSGGLAYGFFPVLPKAVYSDIVASSIAYVESLTNPHHPYTFPMYIDGQYKVNNQFSLYTDGLYYTQNSSLPLFAKVGQLGQANVRDLEDDLPLYMRGLGIRGSSSRTFPLFVSQADTYVPLSRSFSLYAHSEQPIYTHESGINLYIKNNLQGVYSGVPLYVKNVREGISEFDPEYFTLLDNAYPFAGGRSLYLHNNLSAQGLNMYVKVIDTMSGELPMYVMGAYRGNSGIPLFTKAYGNLNHSYKLYTHGF